MDEIRGVVTKAIQVLKEPEMKSNYQRKEIVGRVEKIIDPIFDFREMAKRSLGIPGGILRLKSGKNLFPSLRIFSVTFILAGSDPITVRKSALPAKAWGRTTLKSIRRWLPKMAIRFLSSIW